MGMQEGSSPSPPMDDGIVVGTSPRISAMGSPGWITVRELKEQLEYNEG